MNQLRNTLSQSESETPSVKKQKLNSKRVRYARFTILIFGLISSLFLSAFVLKNQLMLQEKALLFFHSNNHEESFDRIASRSPKKYDVSLTNDIENTDKALKAFLPKQTYIVINTTGNNFKLFDANGKPLREGLVSTGSFTILKAGDNRQWMFKTPRGQLKILKKTKDPVWKRPDWAFIEEGLKVPSANHPSRFEYGTLGDYSMSLGDGYMIHGTLYKRFLGLPVTHGCIRMGDEDLEDVFNTLKIGSKVYIY
jgi:L,D-transpeptidase YbiS